MIALERRNALLDEAKALVLKGWCQDYFAKDAHGIPVSVAEIAHAPNRAKEFCARGACWAASKGDASTWRILDASLESAIRAKFDASTNSTVAKYNNADGRTKYEVAAIFDHAKGMPL